LADAPTMTAEPVANTRLELRDLERALDRLPTEQREVILLVGLEGMPYEEVAEVLGVPVGTVRSRLSRGRNALRQLMGMPEKVHAASARGRHSTHTHTRASRSAGQAA